MTNCATEDLGKEFERGGGGGIKEGGREGGGRERGEKRYKGREECVSISRK